MHDKAIFAVFHLNLAFSSLAEEQREKVIELCYWPLLKIIEDHSIPLGIELTGYTLQEIHKISPQWVQQFSKLIKQGKCELIASGQSQLIGPLVPWQVNRKNIEIGLATYHELLAAKPTTSYINEQAYSNSLLDLHIDAGFHAIFMEWDNAASLHPEWNQTVSHQPILARSASGRYLPVIWNQSVVFQKLQRVCHDDITEAEYLDFIQQKITDDTACFAIYGNDAEVFNFRPGRFSEEQKIATDEWATMVNVFTKLGQSYKWISVSETLSCLDEKIKLTLTTPESPVIVKKQNKYNINRWAITGRDDLYLNSLCYDTFNRLIDSGDVASTEDWKTLCECWGSDYRTHIREERFDANLDRLCKLRESYRSPVKTTLVDPTPAATWQIHETDRRLTLESKEIRLVLNLKKGGAIHLLHFKKHQSPLIGTIEHGVLASISLAADFFSNHLIVELPQHRKRATDLQTASYNVSESGGTTTVTFEFNDALGSYRKIYRFRESDQFNCTYQFDNKLRPSASIRLASFTLLNTDAQQYPILKNRFGGYTDEVCTLRKTALHGKAISPLVSSSSSAGASSGSLRWGLNNEFIHIRWDPAECAAIPMIHNQIEHRERLSRVYFSLSELDETFREHGKLKNFSFTISAG